MYNILHGGNYYQTPVGYGLKPERTTHYELGFSQQIGENASFDVTTFYKDISDQIQFRLILPDGTGENRSYYTLVNGDFATSKGVEFKVTLRRTNRVEAQFNYTFSSAEGTGSGANSSAGSASDQHGYTANIPFPTSFSQAIQGASTLITVMRKMTAVPILQRAGLNLLMQFGSGYPYTLETISQNNIGDARFQVPLEPIGYSTTPWTFEVDLRVDKTVTIGSLDAMFYIYVQNLLNTQNADNVFIRTGDPANDGWLVHQQDRRMPPRSITRLSINLSTIPLFLAQMPTTICRPDKSDSESKLNTKKNTKIQEEHFMVRKEFLSRFSQLFFLCRGLCLHRLKRRIVRTRRVTTVIRSCPRFRPALLTALWTSTIFLTTTQTRGTDPSTRLRRVTRVSNSP